MYYHTNKVQIIFMTNYNAKSATMEKVSTSEKGEYSRLLSANPQSLVSSYHNYSSFSGTSLKHTHRLSSLNLVTNTNRDWLLASLSSSFTWPLQLGKITEFQMFIHISNSSSYQSPTAICHSYLQHSGVCYLK